MEQAADIDTGTHAGSRAPTRPSGEAAAEFLDVWFARLLLLASVALVLFAGIRHAVDQPVYGPIDEAYHTAYVQRVADSGLPPVFGRDYAILAHKTFLQHQVILPGPEPATAPLPYGPRFELKQMEAIQPPFYYYAIAPVAWFTRGTHKIYALRIASCILEVIGIILLYAALRATVPRHPLAAGIAAVVLGSMTGITHLLSQVQNDAMLVPVCVLVLWGFLHDLQQRRVSWWHALAAGLAADTQLVVAPLGFFTIGAVVLYANGGWPSWRELRRLWLPVILYIGPIAPWILLNLHRYHSFLPVQVTTGDQPGTSNTVTELFSRSFQLLNTAESIIAQTAYLPMFPSQPPDTRPIGLLLIATFTALAIALLRQRPELRTVALWVLLAVGTYLIVFYASLTNAARAGSTGEISSIFVARYFVATLAAIAGAVGLTVSVALAGYDWTRRVASVALSVGLIYFSISASSIWHL